MIVKLKDKFSSEKSLPGDGPQGTLPWFFSLSLSMSWGSVILCAWVDVWMRVIELMWYRTEKNTIMLNSQRKRRAGSGIIGDCLFHGSRIRKLAQDLKLSSGSQSCHASYAEDYENIRHSERGVQSVQLIWEPQCVRRNLDGGGRFWIKRCWKDKRLVISYALGIIRWGLILPVLSKEKIDASILSPNQ